jgi:hypothetical protein
MPISANHLASHYIQKSQSKEEAKDRQAARKRVEVMWSRDIRRVIDRYQVATPITVAACLGVNPSPQTPHERTQLRQLYRRLERNAFHGRIRTQYEYTVEHHGESIPKDRQRKFAGQVWYVSVNIQRREGVQYEHKAFIAHVRGTFEKLDTFQLLKTDTELRDAKPPLVYDLYGKMAGTRIAVECNLSDWPKAIAAKCDLWKRYMDNERTDFPFPADRYLWVMETEEKAWNLRDKWIEKGLTSGHFWVTWKDQFSPYRPESILQPIWLWPRLMDGKPDDTLQALREDNHATESA